MKKTFKIVAVILLVLVVAFFSLDFYAFKTNQGPALSGMWETMFFNNPVDQLHGAYRIEKELYMDDGVAYSKTPRLNAAMMVSKENVFSLMLEWGDAYRPEEAFFFSGQLSAVGEPRNPEVEMVVISGRGPYGEEPTVADVYSFGTHVYLLNVEFKNHLYSLEWVNPRDLDDDQRELLNRLDT